MEQELIPRSVVNPGRAASAGFSLLEMVVVVAVLAVLSVSVSFAVGRGAAGPGSDATRFADLFARLREAAVLSRHVQAIAVGQGGWQVMTRGDVGWTTTGRPGQFRSAARFEGATGPLGGPDISPAPDLYFLPDAQVTPFSVTFIAPGVITRCATDGWADLACSTR